MSKAKGCEGDAIGDLSHTFVSVIKVSSEVNLQLATTAASRNAI